MTVTLRSGSSHDVALVMQVMQAAFEAQYGEAWSSSQLLGSLAMPDTTIEMAFDEAAILGFALTRRVGTQAELLLIAVHPDARGGGVGLQLLRETKQKAIAAGVDELFLEVRDGNIAAISLYNSSGFSSIGRRKSYYSGTGTQRYDAITMQCRLSNPDE